MEFSMIWRLRVENQLSSERENVVVAATARIMAGNAAINENSATIRTCRRLPATFCRHALSKRLTWKAITTIIAMISAILMNRAVMTTELRGVIGVRPVRMR